ncbi:MAG TPA: nucleotidyltransferase family protein [Acidimicrobiales bacterium]|nr:nucleotidyltransferase family protein [Acidimicrobiales bacterium]
MADAPEWGFTGLADETRWVLGHGLETTTTPPTTQLDDERWARLCAECSAHRLDGHLVASVVDGSLPATRTQRSEAAAIEIRLARARSDYDDVCRPVLDLLDGAGFPVRLIKGSALPWSDYIDPQLRPTADLDVLVPGVNLLDAAALLIDHGGREVNPEPAAGFARKVFKGLTVVMPSGLEVDLHRILSWGPLGVRVPEADLWAPGRTFDRLGHAAVTLDVERTLIHVSAHLLLLGAIRASEVRDVAQLATSPALDPERTIEIARRWGHEAVLAVALRMAEVEVGLTPGAHPLSQWAAAVRVSPRDRAWLRTDRPDAPIRGVEPVAVLLELRGLRPRLTMLRALLAPRPGTDPSLASRLRRLSQRSLRRSVRSTSGTVEAPDQRVYR